jgi:predicted GH43/DUF377 family glycosyl hydrolase/GR25 family glycosyltransferase involved in LPS biosynthesis
VKPVVLVITCDELAERKQKCMKHFAEMGVEASYLRGIYGKSWGLETTHEFEPGQRISSGHVALDINHYFAWQVLLFILPDGDSYGIVFEDDAVLPKDFYATVAGVVDELSDVMLDWDLVFLGSGDAGIRTWDKVTERIGGPNSRYCREQFPWGTHALMIRKKAIPTLMARMSIAERNMDQQLYLRVLKDNHVNWCMVLPSLVQQRTYDHAGVGKPEWAPSTIDKVENLRLDQEKVFVVSPELHGLTMAKIDPNPCLYRGEFIDDMGTTLIDGRAKSVVVSECARFNVACHSSTHITDVFVQDEKARPCATCGVRLALRKNDNVVRLPVPEGHFNPTMAWYKDRLILITRDSWGHSALGLWHLKNGNAFSLGSDNWQVEPIASLRSEHPDAPRLEDPRAFLAYDSKGNLKLHASVSLPDGYPPKVVRVGYVRFSEDLSRIEYTRIYESPLGSAYEKNWVFFLDENQEMKWVYATKPEHIILDKRGQIDSRTRNKLPWRGGALRGGATPYYSGDRYVHFTHGCLKLVRGNVYSLGCTEFSASWPYNVLRQTPIPLLWPDNNELEKVVKRNVLFPGGVICNGKDYLVVAGAEDTYCVMARIPVADVEAAMTDTAEEDRAVTIRSTSIALGTQFEKANK